MIRQFVVAITFFGIVACATSGPERAANAASPVTNSDSAAAETGGVAVVDVPEVPKSANAGAGDGRICRREHVTGSYRKVRVCRTRAKIGMERQASQQALRELERQSSGAQSGDK